MNKRILISPVLLLAISGGINASWSDHKIACTFGAATTLAAANIAYQKCKNPKKVDQVISAIKTLAANKFKRGKESAAACQEAWKTLIANKTLSLSVAAIVLIACRSPMQ